MKKKIIILGIFTVLMLLTISYATAINNTNSEQKESPLYKIRKTRTIGEKINNIIEKIKSKFIGERLFFLPGFDGTENIHVRDILNMKKMTWMPGCVWYTYEWTVAFCYC